MPRKAVLALFAALALLPGPALAHKAFLVPSSTVLSDGDEAWITVDAAMGNDLFQFNHAPLRVDGLKAYGPDGATAEPENLHRGKWRTSFDLHLTRPGTWRLSQLGEGLLARFTDADGQRGRVRGAPGTLEVPAGASDVTITHVQSRVETFATLGKPDRSALKAAGTGLELVADTHPNDLFAGEEARFGLLLDGKPASGVGVTVIPGGTRYRDQQEAIQLTTDAEGRFALTWPAAGMYWLNASAETPAAAGSGASVRRASYTATLDVLPE